MRRSILPRGYHRYMQHSDCLNSIYLMWKIIKLMKMITYGFFHFWLIKYQVRMYCDLLTTRWLVDCLFGLLLLVLARSSAGETAQSSKLEWGRDTPLALRRRVVKILCFLVFLYFTTCMLLGDENTLFLVPLMCMLLYLLRLWTGDRQHGEPFNNAFDQVVLLFS